MNGTGTTVSHKDGAGEPPLFPGGSLLGRSRELRGVHDGPVRQGGEVGEAEVEPDRMPGRLGGRRRGVRDRVGEVQALENSLGNTYRDAADPLGIEVPPPCEIALLIEVTDASAFAFPGGSTPFEGIVPKKGELGAPPVELR